MDNLTKELLENDHETVISYNSSVKFYGKKNSEPQYDSVISKSVLQQGVL